MNNKNEFVAGFAWRRLDRITERGSWLRDLAIALGVALAAAVLFMTGGAYARDRVIQSRQYPHRHGERHHRQVAGRAHR